MAPKMTAKNLTEISELLEFEDLSYKKCKSYSMQCTDPTLKSKMDTFATNHKKRFNALLDYLNSHE